MAQILKSIIGHKKQIAQLLSVIESQRISSCYLLSGPSGIGKKKVAFAIAQEVLCSNGRPACGECGQCLKVEKNEHEEVRYIEPDGAQIKIAQAEEIHRFLNLQKTGKHRFIIINDAHLMNPQAGNSLLKILEEPPANTTFFLITHSDQAVLKTLRSRSQLLHFSSLSFEDMRKQTDAPDWIIRSSQGRMDLLEQTKDAGLEFVRTKSFSFLRDALSNDLKAATSFKELMSDKESALKLVSLWQQILRDILFYKEGLNPRIHSDQTEVFEGFHAVSPEKIQDLFQNLIQMERDIYGNVDRTLTFENFILNLRS
ncbi:MAG: AAA family ATPase [Bdellovibrionota bacterium]